MDTTRYGIWKEGFTDKSGNYQPSALIKICESKEEAEAKLKDFDHTHRINLY